MTILIGAIVLCCLPELFLGRWPKGAPGSPSRQTKGVVVSVILKGACGAVPQVSSFESKGWAVQQLR